jgi:5-methylcytosine-specific restriction endonuclease McrA
MRKQTKDFGSQRCGYCGEFFVRSAPNQRYCSKECSILFHQNEHKQRYIPKTDEDKTKSCKICGTTFIQKAANQQYCCKDCADVASLLHYAKGKYVIFERDSFQCFYCGKSSYGDRSVLHVDHVLPQILGGLDVAGNLVTACEECNLSKHDNPLHNPTPIFEEINKRNNTRSIPEDLLIKI